ncbi:MULTISPECIES: alpha/beta hydrolase [unclassified Streptomyces]|uniref:alpha/beta hydrolase n=1 Tax=unclassified Streptomyces TaxID=2593676 RepID=UPI0022B6E119|nr:MULTISPECIES: alpha/beta-hydrolase family protein [unclassified Streptomyces]MCZ7416763.1 alpha/beta-hydrolase family protein [Streptomyces sp. WMMC897]MCZ7433427.1 alpha/beta-hydrolase family protein [Streptomyces sp. WMMC1477]
MLDTAGERVPFPGQDRPEPAWKRAGRHTLEAARRPYWDRHDEAWLVRRWPDLTATTVATLFFWLSLTPSLVPRPWALQGVIGGITAAIGYGIGALLSWIVPAVVRWRPSAEAQLRVRAHAWQAYWVLSLSLTVLLLGESADMQRELRKLQELPPTLTWHSMMIALLAVALCWLLLLVARLIRLGTRKLIDLLLRFVPRPVAVTAGLLISAMVVTFGAKDVVFERGVVDIASNIAANTDRSTHQGIVQSDSPFVSGSPQSLIRWEDLGYQGRNFTGSVLSRQQISSFTERPSVDPIRVYVGRAAADGYTEQTTLAMAELERTGAFEREVLAIAGTTGSGWIDARTAEPLEYLYNGDTAIVAIQYSYLPSWVSFLVDREEAGRATRELVTAVRERLDAMPEAERPKFVVFGESMGATAVEDSFDGLDDLLATTDGALLVGPPNYSPVWSEITGNRDPGSPVWRPEYEDGRHVRFAQYPQRDLRRPEGAWAFPRVVYLQNASDPIVWWSPDLALQPPEWLEEPLGPDVTEELNWFPFVTFWQTAVDMSMSYGVEAPHGHRYGTNAVEGWAAVLPPEGWTEADTLRLKAFAEAHESPY